MNAAALLFRDTQQQGKCYRPLTITKRSLMAPLLRFYLCLTKSLPVVNTVVCLAGNCTRPSGPSQLRAGIALQLEAQ